MAEATTTGEEALKFTIDRDGVRGGGDAGKDPAGHF